MQRKTMRLRSETLKVLSGPQLQGARGGSDSGSNTYTNRESVESSCSNSHGSWITSCLTHVPGQCTTNPWTGNCPVSQ